MSRKVRKCTTWCPFKKYILFLDLGIYYRQNRDTFWNWGIFLHVRVFMSAWIRNCSMSVSVRISKVPWLFLKFGLVVRKLLSFGSRYPEIFGPNVSRSVPGVTQLFRSKWLNLFSRCTERKIKSYWPKIIGRILVPQVTQLLGSKWLNFFFRWTEQKNWVILT